MLQKQIADFKKTVRKIKTYTVAEEDAWQLDTCYVLRNRLASAGIGNRQAAVRGMPSVSQKDAETILQTTLAMRGLDKKKHIEAWKEGCLSIPPTDIKMQGVSSKWRAITISGEVWNDQTLPVSRPTSIHGSRENHLLATPPVEEQASQDQPGRCLQDYVMDDGQSVPHCGRENHLLAPIADQEDTQQTATDVRANVAGQLKLKNAKCPTCGAEQKVEGLKLRTRTGFSQLKCKAKDCGEVALSSLWRCRCNL